MLNLFDMKLTKYYALKYHKAKKKEKGKTLNNYCYLTKTKRNTAIVRLKRKYYSRLDNIVLKKKHKKTGRRRKYLSIHKSLVEKCYLLSGDICAERLTPMISEYLKELKKAGHLNKYHNYDIELVSNISSSTVKRMIETFNKNILSSLYKRSKKRGKCDLYKQIPIKAYFGKNMSKGSGFIEVDYVEHNGGNSSGLFAITGTYVDVFSQWINRACGLGKSLRSVEKIHQIIENKMVCSVKEYHPDNAPQILSLLFYKMKENKKNKFILSRSRPYQKNDNAHVEQKNGDKVRELVGHHRYELINQVIILNALYEVSDLYDNFFIPSVKCVGKIKKTNGKLGRRLYDRPQTPYQRLIKDKTLSKKTKQILKKMKDKLSMVKLKQEINSLIDQLKQTMG